jgi:hypothetical protein
MASVHCGFAPTFAAAAAAACAAVLMAACAAPNSGQKSPPRGSPPAAPQAPNDDWQALMLLPFGTLLKDVPYRLDEVVVFHDSAGTAAGREEHECYTLRGTEPPRLFGRPVEGYSLCFSADRLNRIEASVSLAAESAAAQFTAACTKWQRIGNPGPNAAERCGTQDGATELDARLTVSEASSRPTVSIVLIDQTPVSDGGRE